MKSNVWIICLWGLAISIFMTSTAFAQKDESEIPRVTITEVPGGGTDALFEALEELPEIELREREWFEQ